MRNPLVSTVLFLLVSLLSLGCVSKGAYQTVVGERDGLKQQLTTATQERDSLQTKLIATESSLASTKKEHGDLQAKLTASESLLVSAKKERDDLQPKLTASESLVASAKKERDDLQAKLATTEVILTAANRNLSALQTDLSKARSDQANTDVAYGKLRTRTAQAQKYWRINDGLLLFLGSEWRSSENIPLSKYTGGVSDGLAQAGDLPLTAAWDNYFAVARQGGDKQLADFIVLLRNRLHANRPYE
jgi:septal ring factor EnvC (AmiA/AmiB activator)